MAVTVNVKMYQVGELGDCFLLTFKDGKKNSNVLIDCGSFRNSNKSKTRLNTIVKHIKSQLKGEQLDIVVGTHQHNDHVSGFVHCEEEFTDAIKQVWLPWLDNPKDSAAKKIKKEQMDLLDSLKAIHLKLKKLNIAGDFSQLEDVLGFYASEPDGPMIPFQGIENLKKLGANEPAYLNPGEVIDLPGLNKNSVKVYVLGPPRDQKLLFDKDPTKEETYDPHLWQATEEASKLYSALTSHTNNSLREEEQFPFNNKYKKSQAKADKDIVKLYNAKENKWRNIDTAWLDSANQLALFLDGYTNNSSLVLAFELVKSGKVLLFAADAQAGNWLSWEDIKWEGKNKNFKSYDLLENTVLYKVGHHGSHNATLVKALEAMNHEELVAMIPVDKTDSNITKVNGWKMPAKNLFKRLKEKTQNRVLRMDEGFASGCDPVKDKAKSKWKDLPFKPKIDKENFFVEYTIQG